VSRRTERLATAALALWAGLGALFFALPLAGLALRAPWSELGALVASAEVRDALRVSLVASLGATLAALVLGAPIAWVLARTRLPGRALLRGLVTVPLVMPPVVAGVGLLAAFGRYGLLGTTLEAFGVVVPFTTLAAVIAATFVAAPFLVNALEAGLAQAEVRHEQVAATLGASRLRILWSVTLPAIAPSLRAGLVLCGARALGEFGATITFAGNLRGRTQTLPLAIYQTLQTAPERAFLLCAVLLAVSAIALALARRRALV
jgi:molybdate transport system permease protein